MNINLAQYRFVIIGMGMGCIYIYSPVLAIGIALIMCGIDLEEDEEVDKP
jgi:hypothetical protein